MNRKLAIPELLKLMDEFHAEFKNGDQMLTYQKGKHMDDKHALDILKTCEVNVNDQKWCEAMRIAVKALQKTIPLEPDINCITDWDGTIMFYECPNCHAEIEDAPMVESCMECDQKFDWSNLAEPEAPSEVE